MQEQLQWVERLLYRWGDWMRGGDIAKLGYPSQTVEARLMQEGAAAGARRTGRPAPISMPDEVERMEGIILTMSRKQQAVVKRRYVRQAGHRDGARCEGISEGEYRRILEQVRWFVAGAIHEHKM